MADFLTQVKSLTGLDIDGSTDPSQTELSQWLTDGATDVINKVTRLRPNELHKFATSISENNDTGVDVSGTILSVVRGNYIASQIDPSTRFQAKDADSMYYRSAYNPGWYSLNGRIYTIPASDATASVITQVGYPTVAYGDENIAFTYLKKGIQTVTAGTETFNSTANTLSDGDLVRIDGLTGANAVLNGTVGIVTNAATNSFKLQNITIDVAGSIGSDAYFERAGQGFADEYEYLVVMYASIKALSKKLSTKESDLPSDISSLVLEEGTLPVLGTLPVFSAPVTPSSVDVDYTNLPTVNTFTAPSYTVPILEEFGDLNLPVPPPQPDLQSANAVSISGTAPTYIQPVIDLPDVPVISDLSITHRPPVLPTNTLQSMTLTGTPPIFIPPTIDQHSHGLSVSDSYLTLFETTTDEVNDKLTGTIHDKEIPTMPTVPSVIVEQLDDIPTAPTYTSPVLSIPEVPDTDVFTPPVISVPEKPAQMVSGYQGDITPGTITLPSGADIPVFNPPVMTTPDWTDANFWLSTEEDSEMVASRMQVIAGQIQEYQAQFQAAQGQFQEEMNVYQAMLNEQIEEAKMATQTRVVDSQQYTSGAGIKFNSANQAYATEVSGYLQKVNSQSAHWQYNCEKELKKWQTKCDNALKKHSSDQQNAMNVFQKENVEYQAKLQRQLADFGARNQKYTLEIQKYQGELSAFSTELGSYVQVYNLRMQKKLNIYNTRAQITLSEFQESFKHAKTKFDGEAQVYQAKLQEDIKNADLKNDKERRELEIFVHQFKEYTTRTQSDLAEYQANVQKEIQLYQSELQAVTQKMGLDTQNSLNVFNKENVEYQANLQKDIQNAQLEETKDRRELELYSQKVTTYQADVGKELQRWTTEEYNIKFNKWVTSYQNSLAQYNADIQKESAKINADISHYQTEVTKRMNTFQAETGLDMSIYQNQLQGATQKFQADLAEKTTSFDRDLAKYQAIIGNNNIKLQTYGTDIQNYAAKINKLRLDYEWVSSRLLKLQSDYDMAFAIMQPQQQAN